MAPPPPFASSNRKTKLRWPGFKESRRHNASAAADQFRQAVEILLSADEIDSLIVLTIDVGLADMAAVAKGICTGVIGARAVHGAGKTVLTCLMDEQIGRKPISASNERLPNYAFPENAARVLGKLAHYSEWRS